MNEDLNEEDSTKVCPECLASGDDYLTQVKSIKDSQSGNTIINVRYCAHCGNIISISSEEIHAEQPTPEPMRRKISG